MNRPDPLAAAALPFSRRRFVQGFGAGLAVAGLGVWPTRPAHAAQPDYPALSGNHFKLDIGTAPVNFTGKPSMATCVNGRVPAPLLHWREGDTVTLRVNNHLATPSSIHWHGMLVPANMDGVPGLSFPGIPAGGDYLYRFKVRQSGTYWYHSHSRFQEQTGLYGPIVIHPKGGERFPSQRDYVVMLSDWSDTDPERIFAVLRKMSDYYNFNQPTAAAFFADVHTLGLQGALAKRRMWNQMRMSPTDLADVSACAYTYLMNGHTPADNWTGRFSRGEKLRLRFINGAAMSFFDVRIPGLKMTVVAADGQDVEPVSVDELRIAAAETYDVIVQPSDERAYTIFAQSMDRSGYARGTLTPDPRLSAAVPAMDPPQPLSMRDMMGAMVQPGAAQMGDMGDMSTMHHGAMPMRSHHQPAHHASSEHGPGVAMRVDWPRDNLDDPGVGLRNNGRRVLTYADLHTLGGSLDQPGFAQAPDRNIELHLTGNMARYMWSFDGLKASDAKPIHFPYGQRIQLTLVNDTMMAHPIHLHGMWSELESPQGEFQVRKHTLVVQPAQRIRYRVQANAPGRWAYHCHMLYHMEAGMFREVVVA